MDTETVIGVAVTLTFICFFVMSIGFTMMFISRIQMMRADAKDGKPWATDVGMKALAYFGLVACIALMLGVPTIYFARVLPMMPFFN